MQRVGLTGAIDRWQCCGDDEDEAQFEGARATTAFVPTSDAFERLPKKLKSYLFSPFGEKALKKLLEYHIIPNFVLHSGQCIWTNVMREYPQLSCRLHPRRGT